jgi:poly(3-hydroxybutyrate) depolymerase
MMRCLQNALRYIFGLATITAAIGSIGAHPAEAADPLPSFDVDLGQTSVSGLSSGAYMAGQFHVAFSETLIGVGIVAGGPYDCAENSLLVALNRCMQTGSFWGAPDPARLVDRARSFEGQGQIDALANLVDDRVYVFSGTADQTVIQPVVDQTANFYAAAGVPSANIRYVNGVAAGHGFVTETTGNACGVTQTPFINDCDLDQAGDILSHIYGALNPPAATLGGSLIEFDQSEFLPEPNAHGMAASGFAYVPQECADDASCRVHVAFHGCKQTSEFVGDQFRTQTGYNRWADTNRIIVLYPEAHDTLANPNACWDWWGYDDPNYATKTGRQMAAVRGMLDRLAGLSVGPPPEVCAAHTATNFEHWQARRADFCFFGALCAIGSGEALGYAIFRTTLYELSPGAFSLEPCDP